MPLPANNNNKESFRLLQISSNESSEDLQLEIAPAKKKKLHRKGRPKPQRGPDVPASSAWRRGVRYLLWAILLSWGVVVTWTAVSVNDRLNRFDGRLQTVSTSSEGVSDALQHCHSAAKELRANTSALSERLAELTNEHRALADRLTGTAAALSALEEKLAGMPDLTNAPVRLEDLVKMVGDLGSRLSGMEVAVKAAHDTANSAKEGLDEVKQSVERLGAAANASAAERGGATDRLKRLGAGIEALNDTVVARLNATEEKLKQYEIQLSSLTPPSTPAPPAKSLPSRNTQKLPPTAPPPVDNTTTPAAPSLLTTPSTTTTTQAGVPTKPKIVEARP